MKNYPYDVSVIVLTYNHQDFILETLQTIELQDFENVQVVVGDDFSSDATCSIIDSFSRTSKHTYVKLFNNTNVGITNNFNLCLSRCEGKYIFLLGGDDLFGIGKLKAQYEFMELNSDVVISYHDAIVFESASGKKLRYFSDHFPKCESSLSNLIRYGTFFTGCTVAVRNFENLPFCNTKIKYASDWLWYIEILLISNSRLAEVSGVYSRYRRHNDNITSSKNYKDSWTETLISLQHVIEKYPNYSSLAKKTLAERAFAFSLKGLFNKNVSFFVNSLIFSFQLSLISPLLFIWYRRYLILRVLKNKVR